MIGFKGQQGNGYLPQRGVGYALILDISQVDNWSFASHHNGDKESSKSGEYRLWPHSYNIPVLSSRMIINHFVFHPAGDIYTSLQKAGKRSPAWFASGCEGNNVTKGGSPHSSLMVTSGIYIVAISPSGQWKWLSSLLKNGQGADFGAVGFAFPGLVHVETWGQLWRAGKWGKLRQTI